MFVNSRPEKNPRALSFPIVRAAEERFAAGADPTAVARELRIDVNSAIRIRRNWRRRADVGSV